jgi:hypothetical protein
MGAMSKRTATFLQCGFLPSRWQRTVNPPIIPPAKELVFTNRLWDKIFRKYSPVPLKKAVTISFL